MMQAITGTLKKIENKGSHMKKTRKKIKKIGELLSSLMVNSQLIN
jgi:hypothetical protein